MTGVESFIWMSKYAGMREDIVQAGGGNSSYKESADKMYIKGSGVQLADITDKEGFAIVNPLIIKEELLKYDFLTSDETTNIINRAFISGCKPSIETFLHSVMGKYTLHTHPIVVNALTCRPDWDTVLKNLFPDSVMVPYATPGAKLAIEFFKKYEESNKRSDLVFMQNHGLVVSGETAEETIEKMENVLKILESYLCIDYSNYRDVSKLFKFFPDSVLWKVTDSNILSFYKERKNVWDNGFCPDCVVFLGKRPFVVEDGDIMNQKKLFENVNGPISIIFYHDNIFIRSTSVKKAMEIQSVLSFSAQVNSINKCVEQTVLSDSERDFLLNWDVEKYRKDMK